jgi:VanZ family protein
MRIAFVAAGWGIAAIIVWLSVTPAPPHIDIEQSDKLGHLLAYGTLMYWFCLLYTRRATRISYAILWIAMGVGLEFVQREIGYRTFEVYDMVANALGVLIGWGLVYALPLTLPGTRGGTR